MKPLDRELEDIREKLDPANPLRFALLEAEGHAHKLRLSHAKLLDLLVEAAASVSSARFISSADLLARISAAIRLAEEWELRDAESPDFAAAEGPQPSAAPAPVSGQ